MNATKKPAVQVHVSGPEPGQQWTYTLREGQVARIGRRPTHGWSVPWEEDLADEHVELSLEHGVLSVRLLPGASSRLLLDGRPVEQLKLTSQGEFQIGRTTVRVEPVAESGSGSPAKPPRFGKYEVLKKLGEGGMGVVYLARDPQTGRQVALKILSAVKSRFGTYAGRFQAEAKAAAQLQHPNIVSIYESGELGGNLYMALEYVEGINVERLVQRKGPLPVRRTLDIVKQVARALQHAYERGIVHRDIKPSNLIITRDGTVKLTDMGLARSVEEDDETRLTEAGTTVGTVDYMSPEQARNSRSADIRSDIYSLGCTWFHMLTGVPPFPKGSITQKLAAHADQPPPDPRLYNPDIPEGLVAVLHRMMAKSPDERYQTPAELLEDLENVNLVREELSTDLLAALATGEPEPESSDGTTQIDYAATASTEPPDSTSDVRPLSHDAAEPPPGTTAVRSPAEKADTPRPSERPEPLVASAASRPNGPDVPTGRGSAAPTGPAAPPAQSQPTEGGTSTSDEHAAEPAAAGEGKIRLTCPGCGKHYRAAAADAGKKFRCPNCGTRGVVPHPKSQ